MIQFKVAASAVLLTQLLVVIGYASTTNLQRRNVSQTSSTYNNQTTTSQMPQPQPKNKKIKTPLFLDYALDGEHKIAFMYNYNNMNIKANGESTISDSFGDYTSKIEGETSSHQHLGTVNYSYGISRNFGLNLQLQSGNSSNESEYKTNGETYKSKSTRSGFYNPTIGGYFYSRLTNAAFFAETDLDIPTQQSTYDEASNSDNNSSNRFAAEPKVGIHTLGRTVIFGGSIAYKFYGNGTEKYNGEESNDTSKISGGNVTTIMANLEFPRVSDLNMALTYFINDKTETQSDDGIASSNPGSSGLMLTTSARFGAKYLSVMPIAQVGNVIFDADNDVDYSIFTYGLGVRLTSTF